MGNEMGNNSTSGFREEDIIAKDKSQQEIAPVDDFKGQNYVAPAAEDKDSQGKETEVASGDTGREDRNVDDKKTYNNELEEDNMKTEGKESLQEAAQSDDVRGQNHKVPAHDDIYTNGKETGIASISPEGVAETHDGIQKQNEKEDDSNMIPEAKEESLQDDAYANEAKGKDPLVPAAEDETELISTEPDRIGIAAPEKENNSTNIEIKEKSLQEAAGQDEVRAQAVADLVPASVDENTHGAETRLVSNDPDEMAYDGVDNQKEDEKEEDININDEATEKSLQEAASTDDVESQHHLVPAIEDKSTCGYGTGLVSSNPEETADPHVDNPERDEKEEDKANDETWDQPPTKDVDADSIEDQNLIIPAAEGEDCNKMEAEAELAASDLMVVGDTLDIQILEGQEQGASELHPQTESTNVEAEPSDEVSEVREMRPASSAKNLDDHEMHQELNLEDNLPGTSHHFENQNSMMREDEEARNSIPDAASSTSHYLIPQEPAVLEHEGPEQYALAEIDTEQLVEVGNGPEKSEHMIIPSLTCPDQEHGFISDSRVSNDMVERAFVDPSPEVEREKVYVLEEQIAAREVSNEETVELNYGDEDGNNLTEITTTITDLPNGVGAKCNGELPGKMNSSKSGPPESQVETILSDETQNFPLEVSKAEDEGIGLSQKAKLVKEESENEDSKQSDCHIHSVEEPVEQSNGKWSEDGSKADEPNASPPQFMMHGQEREEKRCLLDTSCDSKSSKNSQFEEAKIVENGYHVDGSFENQNEATEEQQKDLQKEVHLVIDTAVISADIFLTDQKYKEEESEEKEIIEEMVEKTEDLNPTSRRESGEQSISQSYPIEQAEASLSPCLALQTLPENQQQEDDVQAKVVQNSNESKPEMMQESCGEFSPRIAASYFVNRNLTEKNVNSMAELAVEKPLLDISEPPKTTSTAMAGTKLPEKQSREQCAIVETPAIDNGDHYQQESVGRLSTESNPDNMSNHAQMRKSPSFDLDLRIDARAEESDQTPLLYQDKTTIDSFSSQADVTVGKVTVVNTESENNKNSLPYEAMAVEEKVVTLERSDSEKSKTPFLGFLKEEEEEAQMLVIPKKQDNHSATEIATKVSAKVVTSASPKGKEKRKPRTSLFGTCMCCAAVIN